MFTRKSRGMIGAVAVLFAVLPALVGCSGCRKTPAVRTTKVAAILPITGPNASFGIGMMNSIQLAVDQANASQRREGLRFELVKLDDASKPDQAVNSAIKACSDPNVVAAIAHWNSGCALATNDIFHRNGLVNIVPGAVNNQITLGNDYDEIMRIVPHDIIQSDYAVRFAVSIAGFKTFYLIDDNTTYGKSLCSLYRRFVEQHGGQVLGQDSISVGEKDFTAVLTKVKNSDPGLVFFGGVVTEAGLIKSQMTKLGLRAAFQSGTGIISDAFIQIAGPAAEGAFSTHFLGEVDNMPGGPVFVEAYQKAGFKDPYESYGIFAYAAAQVVIEAIRRAGPERRSVNIAMMEGTFDTVIGSVSFDKDGQSKLITMGEYMVADGKWKLRYFTNANGELVPVK